MGQRLHKSGALSDLGLPDIWVECLQAWEPSRSHFWRESTVFGFDGAITYFLTPAVLATGHVSLVEEFSAKFSRGWETMRWREKFFQFFSHIPTLCLLGFKRAGQRMLQRMGLDTWDSPQLEVMEAQTDWSVPTSTISARLQLFLLLGAADAQLEQVREVVTDCDAVRDGDILYAWECGYPPEEMAALAAEAIGDDVAERHIESVLQRCQGDWFPVIRCKMLALRGHGVSRRGDEVRARQLWKLSADIAIAEMVPLLAVCTGLDYGGEEGERIVSAACEAVHRPRDTLLSELSDARYYKHQLSFATGDKLHLQKQYTVGEGAELSPLPLQLRPRDASISEKARRRRIGRAGGELLSD